MVYLFLADGHEEIEALTVVDLLRRAKIDIETVSITGNLMVTGSHKIEHKADRLFEETKLDEADMLILPGGMPGTKNLEAFTPLMEKVDEFANSGRNIAAICAAPTVFGHRGLLKGKKACCYPNMESQLDGAEVNFEKVNRDGNIITSRGLGTAIPFALEIISTLKDAETANQIAESIVYNN